MTEAAASTRRRPTLTREQIVTAAIELADRDGLDAVSIRSIASVLDARPMSLYNYIATKDELIEAMVDVIMGEMVLEALPKDWRKALHAITLRTLEVGSQHPWLIEAAFRSSHSGKNENLHSDQSIAALASLDAPKSDVSALLDCVDVFTVGFATSLTSANQLARFDEHLAVFRRGLDWLLDGFERSLR